LFTVKDNLGNEVKGSFLFSIRKMLETFVETAEVNLFSFYSLLFLFIWIFMLLKT